MVPLLTRKIFLLKGNTRTHTAKMKRKLPSPWLLFTDFQQQSSDQQLLQICNYLANKYPPDVWEEECNKQGIEHALSSLRQNIALLPVSLSASVIPSSILPPPAVSLSLPPKKLKQIATRLIELTLPLHERFLGLQPGEVLLPSPHPSQSLWIGRGYEKESSQFALLKASIQRCMQIYKERKEATLNPMLAEAIWEESSPLMQVHGITGPPGSGKTTLLKDLAQQFGFQCIEMSASDNVSLQTRIVDKLYSYSLSQGTERKNSGVWIFVRDFEYGLHPIPGTEEYEAGNTTSLTTKFIDILQTLLTGRKDLEKHQQSTRPSILWPVNMVFIISTDLYTGRKKKSRMSSLLQTIHRKPERGAIYKFYPPSPSAIQKALPTWKNHILSTLDQFRNLSESLVQESKKTVIKGWGDWSQDCTTFIELGDVRRILMLLRFRISTCAPISCLWNLNTSQSSPVCPLPHHPRHIGEAQQCTRGDNSPLLVDQWQLANMVASSSSQLPKKILKDSLTPKDRAATLAIEYVFESLDIVVQNSLPSVDSIETSADLLHTFSSFDILHSRFDQDSFWEEDSTLPMLTLAQLSQTLVAAGVPASRTWESRIRWRRPTGWGKENQETRQVDYRQYLDKFEGFHEIPITNVPHSCNVFHTELCSFLPWLFAHNQTSVGFLPPEFMKYAFSAALALSLHLKCKKLDQELEHFARLYQACLQIRESKPESSDSSSTSSSYSSESSESYKGCISLNLGGKEIEIYPETILTEKLLNVILPNLVEFGRERERNPTVQVHPPSETSHFQSKLQEQRKQEEKAFRERKERQESDKVRANMFSSVRSRISNFQLPNSREEIYLVVSKIRSS